MLDENEYKIISELYGECMSATKEFRKKYNLPLSNISIDERFKPVRDEYKKITGFEETNHNAIMHHRLSSLGPDCPACGKPLRSPKAKLCPECGWKK